MLKELFGRESLPKIKEEEVSSQRKKIWAVGGGKGGIGKTLITANLGLNLARQGYRVLLIDLDLGGANLHTCLGTPLPAVTFSDFIEGEAKSLDDVTVETGIPNLFLINGASDIATIANLKHAQKQRFFKHLRQVEYDYVILDLGAGTSYNTLDFFLEADNMILALVPEPTSIENLYRFVKSAYLRRMHEVATSEDTKQLIENALETQPHHLLKSPEAFLREIKRIDPKQGEELEEKMQSFRPKLIVNMVRTHSDVDMGYSVRSVFRKQFGIDLEYVGYLDYDNSVWQSIRKRRPFLIEFPSSNLVISFDRITNLLKGS